jgi:hypothetical protein
MVALKGNGRGDSGPSTRLKCGTAGSGGFFLEGQNPAENIAKSLVAHLLLYLQAESSERWIDLPSAPL